MSVAAILAFFTMIYDSIRQGKPSIRNNFGAGRLNTRLGFYFFEINRLSFIQKKSFYNNRYFLGAGKAGGSFPTKFLYLTSLDTTLFSYQFLIK